jgi:hypothetical protein
MAYDAPLMMPREDILAIHEQGAHAVEELVENLCLSSLPTSRE